MKLITLNIWGGALTGPLLDFLRATRNRTDIYCFQEVYRNATGKFSYHPRNYEVFDDLVANLPDHAAYYHPSHGEIWGPAMFIKKPLDPVSIEDHFVVGSRGTTPQDPLFESRNIQVATFEKEPGAKFTVVNFHGLWNGKDKDDSPERLSQSQRILDAIRMIKHDLIICGDFNLNPHTESIGMFERRGFRNLIKEYGVTSTRTSHYSKEYSKFADYILVSPDVEVKNLRVLPEEVSDHAALELEFEIAAPKA
jgi:endonuclease/exonuclease/phosphatase family metal-dependent hydrolase